MLYTRNSVQEESVCGGVLRAFEKSMKSIDCACTGKYTIKYSHMGQMMKSATIDKWQLTV